MSGALFPLGCNRFAPKKFICIKQNKMFCHDSEMRHSTSPYHHTTPAELETGIIPKHDAAGEKSTFIHGLKMAVKLDRTCSVSSCECDSCDATRTDIFKLHLLISECPGTIQHFFCFRRLQKAEINQGQQLVCSKISSSHNVRIFLAKTPSQHRPSF